MSRWRKDLGQPPDDPGDSPEFTAKLFNLAQFGSALSF